jgi:6,7-dimethyl-8-ribityllumazine synthase
VSTRESWPGEKPDVSDVEEDEELEEADEEPAEVDEDEETGDDEYADDEEPVEDEDTGDDELELEQAAPQLRVAGDRGELDVPDDIDLLEGAPRGSRRGVGIVTARSNLEVTNGLLEAALAELERVGVSRETITVMAVPGAFELPLGAMALAKTRRYACIVALGCIVRSETASFDLVAAEAASGLQLAALETGVPVAFGVLAVDDLEQARDGAAKGAEAVRTALEMADLFQQLRATAQASK